MDLVADNPIGVFDSGLGGLSILKALLTELPNDRFIYLADSANSPYGGKSDQFVIDRTLAIIDWFVSKQVKAVVVACNTATTVAIKTARKRYPDLLIFGVEPAIKPAAAQSVAKNIGVLATVVTAGSKRLQDLLAEYASDCKAVVQGAPGLVEFVEAGQQDSPEAYDLLKSYLDPMIADGIDVLVLGCTHYIFFEKQINKILDSSVTLLETAEPVAHHVKNILSSRGLQRSPSQNQDEPQTENLVFYSNRVDDTLPALVANLLNQNPPIFEVEV